MTYKKENIQTAFAKALDYLSNDNGGAAVLDALDTADSDAAILEALKDVAKWLHKNDKTAQANEIEKLIGEPFTNETPTQQSAQGKTGELIEAAIKLNAGGLRVIPVWTADKVPFPKWEQYRSSQTENDVRAVFSSRQAAPDRIALILVDGMEAIDIDTKADPARTIDREFFDKVKETTGDAEILKKCILQKTKSGGWHLLYRAENAAGGNLQLAKRRGSNAAVIETRGTEKGLLYVAPSPGYKVMQGDFLNLPTITPEERNILITAARELDERADIAPPAEKSHTAQNTRPQSDQATGAAGALSPWDDFNQRADLLGLLEGYGWHVVSRQENGRARLSKPGAHNARDVHGSIIKTAAGELRFYPFTTATSFAPEKCYSPAAVFGVMECGGDWSKTTAALRVKGYGATLDNQLTTQKNKQGSAANPGRNAGQPIPADQPPPANLATFAAITADRVTIVQDDTAARAALDAGLQNVVDAGPDGLQPAHIRAALDAGAKVFTVCFSDPAATFATVETLLKFHETEQENYFVMAAELPAGFSSLGDFARENGSDAAAALLTDADSAPVYLAKWFANVRAAEIVRDQAAGRADAAILRPYFKAEISGLFRLLPVSEAAYFQHVLNDVAENYFLTWDEIKHDADTLREREAERRYQERAAKLAAQAGQAFADGDAEKAETILSKVKEERGKVGAAKLAGMMEGQDRAAYVGRLSKKGSKLETGYYFKRKGMEPEQLEIPAAGITVVGGSTGHGKTTFLINLLLEICARYPGKEFHFFSLEESAEAQAAKALNCFADMELSARNGASIEAYLTHGTDEFIKAAARLEFEEKEVKFWALIGKQIFFHYPEDSTAENLTAAIRYLHKRRNVGGVFIDYFQLLTLENAAKIRERTEQLKAVCLMVKDTAIETGLPLIFAAQFNRAVSREEDLDFRKIGEAGDIERIAALVVGLWDRHQTPEIWVKDLADKPENISKPAPEMYAKILKQRGGAVGGEGVFAFDANRAKIRTNTPANQAQGAANRAQPGQKFNPNQNPFQNI